MHGPYVFYLSCGAQIFGDISTRAIYHRNTNASSSRHVAIMGSATADGSGREDQEGCINGDSNSEGW